ncbi:MAG: glycosyltransferase family 39 protein [Clostridiales bacterium]|nr:glycosyltransferase family 39 protein [Clostridiales bacterium]
MVKDGRFNTKIILINIAAYAVWALFVLFVSGCDMQYLNPVKIVLLVLGFAGLSFFLIRNAGSEKHRAVMAVITILAVAVRTFYVLYTGAQQRQHDVGEFDTYLENNYHAEYIEYLLTEHKLLAEDIRDHWQFYHPPLHHILCALFFGAYRAVLPSMAHNWDALQALSLLWSLITLEILRKFTDAFPLSPKAQIAAYLTVALHPQLIVFSGAVNNDPLAVMFAVAALYLAWEWYKKKHTLTMYLTALFIGLGMMAKLSAGLVAVPVAYLMLKHLIKSEAKIRTVFQYALFIVICAPLGLWYQVRSYILWRVPFTYVAVPDTDLNPGLLISDIPFWKRFLDFDGSKNYNIISETLNEAVFDGDYYRDHQVLGLIGYFLLASFVLLTVISLAGMIVAWLRKRSDLNTYLTVLVAAELLSYVIFCFRYPYTCTMSFRYIVPVMIAGSLWCGVAYDKGPHLLTIFTKAICYVFAGLSLVFYLLVWIK